LGTICRGELSQLFAPSWREQTKEDYYDRIYSKTASLIAMATESGGILAELPEDQVQSLREYGRSLGTAFQIIDDVLDFVGDEGQLGKPVGSDLRQGTITLPAMYFAWQNPNDESLTRVLDRQEENDEAVTEVITRIAGSEATQTALSEAHDFVRKAREAMGNLPDHPSKEAMMAVADYVVERRV
jgi:geranylgeranyl pyrophosphate synthase